MRILDKGMRHHRHLGKEPVEVPGLEPRFAFDNEGLNRIAWNEFRFMGPWDIKFASNGVHGISVVEALMGKFGIHNGEVLGPLMTDSALAAHLTFDGKLFHVDLSDLEKYETLPGFARLGGKAVF